LKFEGIEMDHLWRLNRLSTRTCQTSAVFPPFPSWLAVFLPASLSVLGSGALGSLPAPEREGKVEQAPGRGHLGHLAFVLFRVAHTHCSTASRAKIILTAEGFFVLYFLGNNKNDVAEVQEQTPI